VLESYILILLAVVISVSHAAIFRLTFNDNYDARFEQYKEAQRAKMVEENEELLQTMKSIIELDPRAVEAMGFEEKWNQMLVGIEGLKGERGRLVNRIHVLYYFTFASVVFSGGSLALPGGLALPLDYTLYLTSISWWLLLGGLLANLYLLLEYQLIERKFSRAYKLKDKQGVRISPEGAPPKAP
jgi:hypothetical protein